MLEYLKGWFRHPRMGRRVPLLLISVLLMGLCVSVFRKIGVGTDPYACFCYGASGRLSMSLGTFEVIFGSLMLLLVALLDRKQIGLGTVANMVLVGYAADFFTWALASIVPVNPEPLARVCWFAPFAALFLASVAVYVVVDLGTAPYDAVPIILHNRLRKRFPRLSFKVTRMGWDTAFTLCGLLVGGPAGLMTAVCCLGLGPAIDWMARGLRRVLGE